MLRLSGSVLAAAGLRLAAPSRAFARMQPDRGSRTTGRRPRAVVVQVASDVVSTADAVRTRIMAQMFDNALLMLGGGRTVSEAWQRFLRPDDVVGVKFNRIGERELATSKPFAKHLVGSLIQAGWSPDHIVLADAPAGIAEQFNTRPWQFGWSSEPVDFGSGQDRISSFVDQVTAIINVPLLKDDNIVGVSGCLKNVTYHLAKHPARYHADGGAPQLADLFALPQISDKLRLNIVNAIRCCYHNGPLVSAEFIDHTGLILMGEDAVAVDAVALETINRLRRTHGLELVESPALVAAAEKGLGHIDFRKIERLTAHDL